MLRARRSPALWLRLGLAVDWPARTRPAALRPVRLLPGAGAGVEGARLVRWMGRGFRGCLGRRGIGLAFGRWTSGRGRGSFNFVRVEHAIVVVIEPGEHGLHALGHFIFLNRAVAVGIKSLEGFGGNNTAIAPPPGPPRQALVLGRRAVQFQVVRNCLLCRPRADRTS